MAFEHEIKLPVASLDGVRARLRERAAVRRHESTFEDNWVLDDAAGSVAARGCLLRVRQWGERASITFKGPARFSGTLKTREELETSLGDADTAVRLLAALGFTPQRRYQKRRELWTLGGIAVALDETPLGPFVELEGDPRAIPAVAAALGLDPADAVPGTYLHLWEQYRASHPGASQDMVFERPDDRRA